MADSAGRKPAVRRDVGRGTVDLGEIEFHRVEPVADTAVARPWRLEPLSLILGIAIAVVLGGVFLMIASRHGGRSIEVTRPPGAVDPEPIRPELDELSQGDQALRLRAEALGLPAETGLNGELRWRVRDGNRATRPFRIETDRWEISWRMIRESGPSDPMMLACLCRPDGEAITHWLNSEDGSSMIFQPPGEYYLEIQVAGGEAEFRIDQDLDPS